MQYINLIFIIVLIHNFIALGSGFTVATLFKLPDIDRRTLTIETGIQNSALALALIFNDKIFDPNLALGGMAFIAAWWGVWHIISGLSIATLWSKKRILQAI
jgi:BASS family bile acid:Na+ symporter